MKTSRSRVTHSGGAFRSLSASLLLCVAAAGLGAPRAEAREDAPAVDPALMLRLRDGSIHWGRVQGHDPDGIVFQRLENGGVARIAWSFLEPGQEKALRSQFGYVEANAEEVTIEADRLILVDGSEVVGLIVDRTNDALLVKQNGATVPVPKNRIAGASTTVQIAATAVYTREELYNRELGLRAPASAEGHFGLAQFCERILDYAHARTHYAKASELDPAFRKDDVAVAIQRVTEKAKAQDQIDYLADVDLLTARRKYDEALTRALAFAEKYAGSALVPDAKKREERIVKARDRDVAERVARRWHEWAGRLARQAAAKLTYAEALAYLDEQMQREIEERVTKDVQGVTQAADADSVRRMWKGRKKGPWMRASYGDGTWLLGRDRALKGEEPEKEGEEVPLTEKDKQRADLEKRIVRFLQNQELARKSKSKAEQGDEVEEFWKAFPSASRAQWMLAYYAENSGDMDVSPKPLFNPCRDCGGGGTREMSLAGGNVAKSMIGKGQVDQTIECPTCHGLGRVRRISYR